VEDTILTGFNPVLSTEMITEQVNDYVVKELTNQFTILKSYCLDNDISGKKIFTNKYTKDVLNRIDDILVARFGLKTKHIYGKGIGYGIFTAPPKSLNTINRDILDNYTNMKEYIDIVMKGKDVPADSVNDVHRDEDALIANWVKSIDSIDSTLNGKGLHIDLNKAYIKGLDKDYLLYIAADFDMLFKNVDLSPEELTSVLLHEVGHGFTHIEYSYRSVRTTSVIADAVKDITVNNGSTKKNLQLAYGKLGGTDNKISEANTMSATIMVIDSYIKSTLDLDVNNTHSATDSEQLADQFAGKFGLSGALSTSLAKMESIGLNIDIDMTNEEIITLSLSTVAILILLPATTVTLYGLIIAGSILMAYIIDFIIGLWTGGDARYGVTYDDRQRRQQRIRNEMVRRLRNTKLPKDVMKQQLTSIESIDKVIANLQPYEDTLGIGERLGRILFAKNRKAIEAKELDQLIEDNMENDLHVLAAKLKII